MSEKAMVTDGNEQGWTCPNCDREWDNESARRESHDGTHCIMCDIDTGTNRGEDL